MPKNCFMNPIKEVWIWLKCTCSWDIYVVDSLQLVLIISDDPWKPQIEVGILFWTRLMCALKYSQINNKSGCQAPISHLRYSKTKCPTATHTWKHNLWSTEHILQIEIGFLLISDKWYLIRTDLSVCFFIDFDPSQIP